MKRQKLVWLGLVSRMYVITTTKRIKEKKLTVRKDLMEMKGKLLRRLTPNLDCELKEKRKKKKTLYLFPP